MREPSPAWRLWSYALASGVPFAFYVATLSAHDYWLDSPEFVAAATTLGIPHPPGNPLTALVAAIATLFPVGPLPLRVALASAIAAAAAAGFFFRAVDRTLRALGPLNPFITGCLALGATWIVAGATGVWFQAVRPEVYALEALFTCIVLERLVAFETSLSSQATHDYRALYTAAVAEGFALSNHHLIALLMMPVVAASFARAVRLRGRRPLFIGLLSLGPGLAMYTYLPIRAAAGAALNLGSPDSIGRFFWVVSAQAFQKNTGTGVPLSFGERFADVLVLLVSDVHGITVLCALAGLYVLARTPSAKRLAFVWGATLAITILARAWLGFARGNPDASGYLFGATAALAALAAAFVAALLLLARGRGVPNVLSRVLVVVLSALAFLQFPASRASASLAHFTVTDDFADARYRDLPRNAVILAYAPQTVFRLWGTEASERVRPDISVVPMPFLTYPRMIDSTLERDPSLGPLLRGYLLDGNLRSADLQTLATRRPVFVELDLRFPIPLFGTIVPSGLLYEVMPDGGTETDERLGAADQKRVYERLYARLGPLRGERETSNHLLWSHYMDALYYATLGDRESARWAVDRGLAIDPAARELRALKAALGRAPSEGPLDPAAFLPDL